jgi:hypothetical protein
MDKKHILLLVVGFVFLFNSVYPSITGAVIGDGYGIVNELSFIIGMAFLIGFFVLHIHSKSLEAIVIPTGSLEADEERSERAMIEYPKDEEKTPYILVTGDIHRDAHGRIKKDSQQSSIYKELRGKYGLTPSDMIIEGKSRDTLENFLYSIRKLKKKDIKKIEISTNRTQYWRFKMFEREAKKEGLIGEDFEISPLYTDESFSQFAYGTLALAKDYLRVKVAGSLKKAVKNKGGIIGNIFKEILSKE